MGACRLSGLTQIKKSFPFESVPQSRQGDVGDNMLIVLQHEPFTLCIIFQQENICHCILVVSRTHSSNSGRVPCALRTVQCTRHITDQPSKEATLVEGRLVLFACLILDGGRCFGRKSQFLSEVVVCLEFTCFKTQNMYYNLYRIFYFACKNTKQVYF